MKQEITVTEFRSNIYQIMDELVREGGIFTVMRKGVPIRLVAPDIVCKIPKKKKIRNDLSKIKPFMKLPLPPEDYISMNVDEWKPL